MNLVERGSHDGVEQCVMWPHHIRALKLHHLTRKHEENMPILCFFFASPLSKISTNFRQVEKSQPEKKTTTRKKNEQTFQNFAHMFACTQIIKRGSESPHIIALCIEPQFAGIVRLNHLWRTVVGSSNLYDKG